MATSSRFPKASGGLGRNLSGTGAIWLELPPALSAPTTPSSPEVKVLEEKLFSHLGEGYLSYLWPRLGLRETHRMISFPRKEDQAWSSRQERKALGDQGSLGRKDRGPRRLHGAPWSGCARRWAAWPHTHSHWAARSHQEGDAGLLQEPLLRGRQDQPCQDQAQGRVQAARRQ